jgi:hypothetical protein
MKQKKTRLEKGPEARGRRRSYEEGRTTPGRTSQTEGEEKKHQPGSAPKWMRTGGKSRVKQVNLLLT